MADRRPANGGADMRWMLRCVFLLSLAAASAAHAQIPGGAFTPATSFAAAEGGYDPFVTMGADGLGLIAYLGGNPRKLNVAHCSNPACSAVSTVAVDDQPGPQSHSQIVVGS